MKKAPPRTHINSLPVGIYRLDENYAFAVGQLTIIGARPSMGLTQLLVQLAISFSRKVSVTFITTHNQTRELMSRLAAIDPHADLSRLSILQTQSPHETLAAAVSAETDAVIVDRLDVDFKRPLGDRALFEKLTTLRKELSPQRIVVIGFGLGRSVEWFSGDHVPTLASVSDRIICDLDPNVYFLYRYSNYGISIDEYGEPTDNMSLFVIARQRNMMPYRVRLVFDGRSYKGEER